MGGEDIVANQGAGPDATTTSNPIAQDAGSATPRDAAPDVAEDVARDVGPPPGRALALAADGFFEVLLPEATLRQVGPPPIDTLGDIAFSPDRSTLYGIGAGLFAVDIATGQAKMLEPFHADFLNGLDVSSDGALYGAGGSAVFEIDVKAGDALLADLPGSLLSAGDLAFVGGRLFGTGDVIAVSGGGSVGAVLYEVDLRKKTTRIVGQTRDPAETEHILGLAVVSGELYGFTLGGRIVRLDLETGRETEIASTEHSFLGAASW
jgi:hypothetical protein